jgi:hypothetical protein
LRLAEAVLRLAEAVLRLAEAVLRLAEAVLRLAEAVLSIERFLYNLKNKTVFYVVSSFGIVHSRIFNYNSDDSY